MGRSTKLRDYLLVGGFNQTNLFVGKYCIATILVEQGQRLGRDQVLLATAVTCCHTVTLSSWTRKLLSIGGIWFHGHLFSIVGSTTWDAVTS